MNSFVYLKMHNDLLHPRILKRIKCMIDDGMIDEVKEIIKDAGYLTND